VLADLLYEETVTCALAATDPVVLRACGSADLSLRTDPRFSG